MHLFIRNFRSWWKRPRKADELIEHRQVSFLELFYDLVYVAIIAQLSHTFSHDISLEGARNFAFLFIMVWWAWVNGSMYHDVHGNDDVRTRTFTFLQMLFVVLMAIFAHNAIGKGSQGFALSYAGFQLVMTIMWWRVGVYDKDHRPFSIPYSFFFLVNTALFVISAFVDEQICYLLWGIATSISVLLPLSTPIIVRKRPIAQAQLKIMTDSSPSLVERFGLLTIIVVGEVVVGVVNGATGLTMSNSLVLTALLGTALAISVWRVYFDFISHKIPKKGLKWFGAWYYLHLPLTIGIVALGAALLNIVAHIDEALNNEAKWLLIIAPMIILFCTSLLVKTLREEPDNKTSQKAASITMFISIFLMPILGFLNISPIWLLLGISTILTLPKSISFLAWLREID